MLNLDDVDWSGLPHAHGEADDVPELLARLDDGDWDEASDELYFALLHDGIAYPATLAAVPFLTLIARNSASDGQLSALHLLGHFTGFAADGGPEAVAVLERSAQELAPLLHDPDPSIRQTVYGLALGWPDPAPLLRARLHDEHDGDALLELVRILARIHALSADDLSGFGDDVVFAGARSSFVHGHEMPGLIELLAGLWAGQAQGDYGSGSGYPLCRLVEDAGGRASGLLTRLMSEPGISVGELAWAWHDVARISRAATEPALRALLALLRRADVGPDDVEDLLVALIPLVPVAGELGPELAEALTALPSAPESQATLAVALFALGDARWVTPALVATTAEQVPWVTVNGTSLEFTAALAALVKATAPTGLTCVARAGIAAWPETAGTWIDLLAQLPPSAEIVQVLLEPAGPTKPALRLLARIALTCPDAFDVATFQAVQAIPVPGGDAGAWLLVAQALLDSGDPAGFSRAWRVSESGDGEDELLRIWATHPSAELEKVCLELATRTSWGVYRNRAVQVAAIEILLSNGPEHLELVWPAVPDLLPVLKGEALDRLVALGNRLVTVRSEWLSQLRELTGSERPVVAMKALEARQALGDIVPEQSLEQALSRLNATVGARARVVADVVPLAARVIGNALAAQPDLRVRASAQVTPLIAGDERVLEPGDVATDTRLVRILHEALTK
ncbi:hypothetical protein [Kineosporia babensis]|uniref:HEAT repeat domain-containing protein n=1 Tax=Kineosporia babensis TaxID=499548 RepID=A0A9X1STD2_9ACTN|nr:hypothetical protein [Kineosporia babensis]MCD5311709.1 hypothetical protein [Kineosporia babensis]